MKNVTVDDKITIPLTFACPLSREKVNAWAAKYGWKVDSSSKFNYRKKLESSGWEYAGWYTGPIGCAITDICRYEGLSLVQAIEEILGKKIVVTFS